jgi:hypothetical protein
MCCLGTAPDQSSDRLPETYYCFKTSKRFFIISLKKVIKQARYFKISSLSS